MEKKKQTDFTPYLNIITDFSSIEFKKKVQKIEKEIEVVLKSGVPDRSKMSKVLSGIVGMNEVFSECKWGGYNADVFRDDASFLAGFLLATKLLTPSPEDKQ